MQVILHWQGPKAERCLQCYIGLWEQSTTNKHVVELCKCPVNYDTLWNMAMEADRAALYRAAMTDHNKYAEALGDDVSTFGLY